MSDNTQNRLVTESFLTSVLVNLREWLPFRKESGKLNFINENKTPVFSIESDGEIYYIHDPNTTTLESLQTRLNKIGLQIIETESEFNTICTDKNVDKLIFLTTSGEQYTTGLYSIIKDNDSNVIPKLLLENSNITDTLKNYYTKSEVVDYLTQYVSKDESKSFVTTDTVNEIVLNEINQIFKTDNNGDISINLENYVKTETLTATLADYVKTEALSSTLNSYVKSETLTSSLADYVKTDVLTSTLTDYVKTEALTSALVSYVKAETLTSALDSYVKAETLNNYISKDNITKSETLILDMTTNTIEVNFKPISETEIQEKLFNPDDVNQK